MLQKKRYVEKSHIKNKQLLPNLSEIFSENIFKASFLSVAALFKFGLFKISITLKKTYCDSKHFNYLRVFLAFFYKNTRSRPKLFPKKIKLKFQILRSLKSNQDILERLNLHIGKNLVLLSFKRVVLIVFHHLGLDMINLFESKVSG